MPRSLIKFILVSTITGIVITSVSCLWDPKENAKDVIVKLTQVTILMMVWLGLIFAGMRSKTN